MMKAGAQFVVFGLIGVVNTSIQYVVFLLLLRSLGAPLLAASTVGYLCGLINSYLMNRRWTFRVVRPRSGGEFLRFGLVNLVALGVNLGALALLVRGGGMMPEVAQILAIAASLLVNFVGNKWWTFATGEKMSLDKVRVRTLWLPGLVTVVLVGLLVFWNLGGPPLRIWDESRLAINALELYQGGDWLVPTFEGAPDMWNTKPPLLIWIQAATMKLIGPGDLAVRLPSAFAAVLTGLLLVLFARTYLGSAWFGVVAALVMATSPGYLGFHGARAGDYDVPLTLLTTLSCLAFFLRVETGRARWLYVFFGALALAILTKSSGAVVFLPAIGLYALWRRQVPALLRCRHFWAGAAILVVSVGGYYGLREAANPGYLAMVQANELGGRYLGAIENHDEKTLFFVENLLRARMPGWVWLIVPGMAMGFLRPRTRIARQTRFATLLVAVYFLIISFARTKCRWYDVPTYPFLGLIVAALPYQLLDLLRGRRRLRYAVVVVLVMLVGWFYNRSLTMVRNPEDNRGFYLMGYALKAVLAGERDLAGADILLDSYSPQNDFYLRLLQDRGVTVSRADWATMEAGARVVVADGALSERLVTEFDCEVVEAANRVTTYELRGRRESVTDGP